MVFVTLDACHLRSKPKKEEKFKGSFLKQTSTCVDWKVTKLSNFCGFLCVTKFLNNTDIQR